MMGGWRGGWGWLLLHSRLKEQKKRGGPREKSMRVQECCCCCVGGGAPAAAGGGAAVRTNCGDKEQRCDGHTHMLLLLLLKQHIPSARRLQQLLHKPAGITPIHNSNDTAAAAAAARVDRLHSMHAGINVHRGGGGTTLRRHTHSHKRGGWGGGQGGCRGLC
jgi:hypothetical protein